LALRGVGPESEAESVRFHGRRVTKVGPGVKPSFCHGQLGCSPQALAYLANYGRINCAEDRKSNQMKTAWPPRIRLYWPSVPFVCSRIICYASGTEARKRGHLVADENQSGTRFLFADQPEVFRPRKMMAQSSFKTLRKAPQARAALLRCVPDIPVTLAILHCVGDREERSVTKEDCNRVERRAVTRTGRQMVSRP
jgi:hypothetical protein